MKNNITDTDLQRLPIDQLGQQYGKAMSRGNPVKLLVEGSGKGHFDLEMDVFPSILIYKTNVHTETNVFQMPLYREEPTLNLMFQEQGVSYFGSKTNPALILSPDQQTLQFFPGIDSNFNIHKDEKVENLNIKLKVDYFKEYVIENRHLGGWFYEKMEKNELISTAEIDLSITPEIRIVLHQIKNCPYKGTFKRLFIDGLVKVLLTYQLDCFNRLFLHKKPVWEDQKINSDDVGKLHEVREYLNRNYLDTLSLSGLSRRFFLNEFKLKYGFKKLFGISVMQFIYDLRLNHSKRLLLETDHSILNIAEMVGYEHPNNFSAVFKKRFGQSPSVYRDSTLPVRVSIPIL